MNENGTCENLENNSLNNNEDNNLNQNQIVDDMSASSNYQESQEIEDKKNLSEFYQWDYEKYSKMNQFSQAKANKNKGAVIFGSILGSLLLISGLAYGGVKLSRWVSDLTYKQEPADVDEQVQQDKNETQKSEIPILDKESSDKSIMFSSSGLNATSIAEKVIPSVVSVIPYARVQSLYQTGITEIGSASGIIKSSDGYIITNAHVVLKSPSIMELVDAVKVILNDGREYEAKIVGVDINTDLAVLKIDATGLPAAEFGDSNQLKVGEQVFAIGSPVDTEYSGSMTAGIVSALNRSISSSSSSLGSDNKCIQTDAAINPGNSGGALVNNRGQVIGVNEGKLSNVSIEGMGFAIPIKQVENVLDNLIKYGHVKDRALLGIVIHKEIDEIVAKLSNNIKTGLLIAKVTNPSLNMIQEYDILHEFNGKKIESLKELKDELKKYKPNDKVKLVFYRYDSFGNNEQKIEVDATLMEDEGLIKK